MIPNIGKSYTGPMGTDKVIKEYVVLYDAVYGIILSGTASETNLVDTGFDIEMESYITNTPAISLHILQDKIPEEIREELMKNPRLFVYDPKTGDIRRRPSIVLSVEGDYPLTSGGHPILPLNTDITVKVTYDDPDEVDFWSIFDFIKLKDRASFVIVDSKIEKSSFSEGTMTFTIKSAFPGVARLRAKDNKFLCEFNLMAVRFRQGA